MSMDLLQVCCNLAPCPFLATAAGTLRFIYVTVQQVQESKHQLHALTQSVGQLLDTLHQQYLQGHIEEARLSKPMSDLCRLLEEILTFVQKETFRRSFLTLLFMKTQRISKIESYHKQVEHAARTFQIATLLNMQAWQARNEKARAEDQLHLSTRLRSLEGNQQELRNTLEAQQDNILPMIISLKRRSENPVGDDDELQFYNYTLRCLTTFSGRRVEVENWMITPYEVELGPEVGSGGFGQVHTGTWQKMEVAIKVLKTPAGISPNQAIRREINTWSQLRHPHVLQFLGANILDDNPFIVMPYMKNGNARQYIENHPNSNRLKILCDVSLGLYYLHQQRVAHGDLKAVNVLVDNDGKAILCDFGLSRVKADVTTRAAKPTEGIIGSRNWMAPERLLGGPLKLACDIYAFSMLVYEVYTSEVPFAEFGYTQFIELVARENHRPERPDEEDAPGLPDTLWALVERCWEKNPKARPKADEICDVMRSLADEQARAEEAQTKSSGISTGVTLDEAWSCSAQSLSLEPIAETPTVNDSEFVLVETARQPIHYLATPSHVSVPQHPASPSPDLSPLAISSSPKGKDRFGHPIRREASGGSISTTSSSSAEVLASPLTLPLPMGAGMRNKRGASLSTRNPNLLPSQSLEPLAADGMGSAGGHSASAGGGSPRAHGRRSSTGTGSPPQKVKRPFLSSPALDNLMSFPSV